MFPGFLCRRRRAGRGDGDRAPSSAGKWTDRGAGATSRDLAAPSGRNASEDGSSSSSSSWPTRQPSWLRPIQVICQHTGCELHDKRKRWIKAHVGPPVAGALRACFNPSAQVEASSASTSMAPPPLPSSSGGNCWLFF